MHVGVDAKRRHSVPPHVGWRLVLVLGDDRLELDIGSGGVENPACTRPPVARQGVRVKRMELALTTTGVVRG